VTYFFEIWVKFARIFFFLYIFLPFSEEGPVLIFLKLLDEQGSHNEEGRLGQEQGLVLLPTRNIQTRAPVCSLPPLT
jgi:hypothetical protein